MTEPQIPSATHRPRHGPRTMALIGGASLAVLVGAAVTLGASPSASPAASSSLAASTSPTASGDPVWPDGGPKDRLGRGVFDGRGRFGGPGMGGVTIAAINGSTIRLETEDGWTRTIALTSTTAIIKGGETAEVNDLAIGDRVRFAQTRNADGTFTVTAIQVIPPRIAGIVSAVTGSAITVTARDGSSQTIRVDAGTTYTVAGVTDAELGDVAVGMRLGAVGTLNADGSLDATAIRAGVDGFPRNGNRGDHGKPGEPAPSASPESSSSTG